jgi:hypothetical protein
VPDVPAVTLTVTGKRAPLDVSIVERVGRVAERLLPFDGYDHEQAVCRSESGRTALFAWRPRGAWDDQLALVHRDAGAAVVAAGSIFPPTGRAVSDLLRAAERSREAARDLIRSFHGTCALTHVDLTSDETRHWTVITRLQSVFWAETDDLVVAGSRAAMVHLVASGRDLPTYDRLGLATLASVGWFPNDLTPFRGVRVVPSNAELAITPAAVRVETLDDAVETAVPRDAPLTDDQVDVVADALLDAARVLRSFDQPIEAGITSGKDSRLVVATLKASGVPFSTYTNGDADSPEVILGARVADALGVPHRRGDPAKRDPTMRVGERIDRALFVEEGLRSAWALADLGKPASGPVRVGGGGGGLLRAGYTKGVLDKLPLTRDDAVSRIDFLLSRFDGLLHPELAAAKRQLQDQWIDRRLRTMAGEDLLHRLHLEYRVGRWGAAGQPTRTLLRPHYQPLFDPVAVRSALAVGILARATDRLLERLLLRFAPALLEIPLGTTRFTFERSGPRPGDERRVTDVASRSPERWIAACMATPGSGMSVASWPSRSSHGSSRTRTPMPCGMSWTATVWSGSSPLRSCTATCCRCGAWCRSPAWSRTDGSAIRSPKHRLRCRIACPGATFAAASCGESISLETASTPGRLRASTSCSTGSTSAPAKRARR